MGHFIQSLMQELDSLGDDQSRNHNVWHFWKLLKIIC